jgi:sugar phosphate isomerase/epimerase
MIDIDIGQVIHLLQMQVARVIEHIAARIDGVTFERFLARVDNHPRCNMLYDPSHLHLQQMDYEIRRP